MSRLGEMGGRRTAAEVKNATELRKYKVNDSFNASGQGMMFVEPWLKKAK